MHALLVSAGTAGNMLPFIGLAAALRARGHDVTLIGSGSGTDALRAMGVGFADLEEPGAGRELSEADSAAVHKPSFLGSLVPRAVRYMRKVYQLIAERHVPGETIVVSQGWLFGSRIAQEKLGVPLATVQLQPLLFGSAYDTPGLPRWVPRCVPRLVNRVVERSVDWALAKAIDTLPCRAGDATGSSAGHALVAIAGTGDRLLPRMVFGASARLADSGRPRRLPPVRRSGGGRAAGPGGISRGRRAAAGVQSGVAQSGRQRLLRGLRGRVSASRTAHRVADESS